MIAASAEDGKYLLFKGWVIDKSTWKDLLDRDPGLQPWGPPLHELPDPPKKPAPTEEEIAMRREAWAMEMDAQEEEDEDEEEETEESEEREESDEEAGTEET